MPLSADDIQNVVSEFYSKVRKDAILGPIFATHITDWPAHETKISNFWRNAILRERVYDGNPMIKHRQASNVKGEHFALWLALFDETLSEHLAKPEAQAWSHLAHRIGRSLRMGLEMNDVPQFG